MRYIEHNRWSTPNDSTQKFFECSALGYSSTYIQTHDQAEAELVFSLSLNFRVKILCYDARDYGARFSQRFWLRAAPLQRRLRRAGLSQLRRSA